MGNSQMIGTCKRCDHMYCWECSDAFRWQDFCCMSCEDKYDPKDDI